MCREDELTCMIHALQERCDELESRLSLLEDEAGLNGSDSQDCFVPCDERDWEGEIHFEGEHAEADWNGQEVDNADVE